MGLLKWAKSLPNMKSLPPPPAAPPPLTPPVLRDDTFGGSLPTLAFPPRKPDPAGNDVYSRSGMISELSEPISFYLEVAYTLGEYQKIHDKRSTLRAQLLQERQGALSGLSHTLNGEHSNFDFKYELPTNFRR